MLLQDNRISMRIQDQVLNEAKKRTQQLIKERNHPISLSAYVRELIELDTDKQILK